MSDPSGDELVEQYANELADLEPDQVLEIVNRTLKLKEHSARPGKAEARRRFGNTNRK